jgi:tetratricopeptide (TPR) repeat protein
VAIEVGSDGNPNFIQVRHGKMLINVPKCIFKGRTSALVESEVAVFKVQLASRYPWLSRNAIQVILEEARRTMESILDMERTEVEKARKLFEEGRLPRALRMVEERLKRDPQDADAWYLKGEILFKLGEKELGYQAFAKARSLTLGQSRPEPHARKGR